MRGAKDKMLVIRKNKGITLIALIVTIIVLLILSGVTISMLLGNSGLINMAANAGKENNKMQALEELRLRVLEVQADKQGSAILQDVVNDLYYDNEKQYIISLTQTPDESMEIPDVSNSNEIYVIYKNYQFKIDSDLNVLLFAEEVQLPEKNLDIGNNESLIGRIYDITESGVQDIVVNGETYSANILIYNEDLILDGITEIQGANLNDNVYEFGDKSTDVGTESENAKNMVIVKVNGDLTINSEIILTACKSDEGYGGPKGLFIYCTGTITNNGTITMTARGAKATGQNVYLWQNENGEYEYVPATGASKTDYASATSTNYDIKYTQNGSSGYHKYGISGNNGAGRQTRWRWFWLINYSLYK